VDDRYFGPSSLPNPNSNKKIFSSPRPKGGRSSTPLSSSLHSFPFPLALRPSPLSAAAAAAMVALASLSSLCPCGLARRRAASASASASASVSISCCAVATPSSGKGTHGCPPPPLLISAAYCEWSCGIGNGLVLQLYLKLVNHRVELMLVPIPN
jgi:hypothetical protein